jgi:hypothetical protein
MRNRIITATVLLSLTGCVEPPDSEQGEANEEGLARGAEGNAMLARWAPINYQAVSSGSSQGYGGRGDYLAPVDYDGDWKTRNNWDNLPGSPPSAFKAVAYTRAVESDTHWFLYYMFYHPIDWTSGTVTDEHENDAESIYLMIRKDRSPYGRLEAVLTEAHGGKKPVFVVPGVEPKLRQAEPWSGFEQPGLTKRNVIRWERPLPGEGFERFGIYQEAEGHGIYACGYDDGSASGVTPYSRVFNCTNQDVGIRYVPRGQAGVPPERAGIWSEVSYALLDVDILYQQRWNHDLWYDAPFGMTFGGDKSPGCGNGLTVICRTDAAHPIWHGTTNPAELFKQYFTFDASAPAPGGDRLENAFTGYDSCEPGPDEASVFSDANYQGSCVTFAIDPRTGRNAVHTFGANLISSIKLGADVNVIVFERAHFWPSSYRWTENISWVRGHDNNIAALLVVSKDQDCDASTEARAGEILLFEEENFGGHCTAFDLDDGDVPYLGHAGFPNDLLSSFKVGPNTSVTFYVDPDFRGQQFQFGPGNHNSPAFANDAVTGFRIR